MSCLMHLPQWNFKSQSRNFHMHHSDHLLTHVRVLSISSGPMLYFLMLQLLALPGSAVRRLVTILGDSHVMSAESTFRSVQFATAEGKHQISVADLARSRTFALCALCAVV